MGMDPAGVNPNDPRTFNRFAYANNNPYMYVDPDGRTATVLGYALVIGTVAYVALAADPNRQQRIDKLKQGFDVLQQGWKAFNEGGDDESDTVQEEYDSLDAAVGSVDSLDDVEFEGKTKNRGLREQGFTEKWTGVDSDGIYQSGFKNPKTGKWTGGHESSRNNQNK